MQYELWGGAFSDLSKVEYMGVDVLGYITTPDAGASTSILSKIQATGCNSVINIFNNNSTPLGTQGAQYLEVVQEIAAAGWGAIAGDMVPGDVVTTVEKYLPFINCGGDGGGYQLNMYAPPYNQPTGGPFPHYDYIRTFTNNLVSSTSVTNVLTFAQIEEDILTLIESTNWLAVIIDVLTAITAQNIIGGAILDVYNIASELLTLTQGGNWLTVAGVTQVIQNITLLLTALEQGNFTGSSSNLINLLLNAAKTVYDIISPQVTLYMQSLPGTQIWTADSTISDLLAAQGAGSSGYGIIISADLESGGSGMLSAAASGAAGTGNLYDIVDLITLAGQQGVTVDTIVLSTDINEDIIEPVTSGVFKGLLSQLQSLYPPNTPVFPQLTPIFALPTINPIVTPTTTTPTSPVKPPGGTPITVGSNPAVVNNGANPLDVFATGPSKNLYHIAYNGAWGTWENLGGTLTSSPAAVSRAQGIMTVYACGGGNAVYQLTYENGKWGTWQNLGGQAYGVSGCSWSSSREDLFAQALNGAVYHKYWNGNSWSAWEKIGGNTTCPPSAIATSSNTMSVFVRGTDSFVYENIWNGYGWAGWTQVIGSPAILNKTGPCAYSHGSQFYIFVTGTDNTIWFVPYNSGWGTWSHITGVVITSSPAITIPPSVLPSMILSVVPTAGEEVHYFGRGNDKAVWHMQYNGATWSNWNSIGGSLW